MTRLTWDSLPTQEAGVDRGVFYPATGSGVAWNGLSSVGEAPTNSEEQVRYVDGIKTRIRRSRGEFAGAIEAFTYPDEFYENVLVQKRATTFGLCYRIPAGDSYRIHLVYNVVLVPDKRSYKQRETDIFRWNFTTLPIPVTGAALTAHLILDGNFAYPWVLEEIEDILYGSDDAAPRLPLPQELIDIAEAGSILIVTDHGDGTFTVTGPDEAITTLSATTFEITWPSVLILDPDTYQISSL